MSEIVGGSQSSSNNKAYNTVAGNTAGSVANGNAANNQLANMLGLNGPQGQNTAFNNYNNSTGYQFGLQQGQDSITGNAATQGLLNSGSTLKALDTYGQNYANTQTQNYMNQLNSVTGQGLQGDALLAQTGQQSNSSSTNGVGKMIGQLMGK